MNIDEITEKYIGKLRKINAIEDNEDARFEADECIITLLREIGLGRIAAEYDNLHFILDPPDPYWNGHGWKDEEE